PRRDETNVWAVAQELHERAERAGTRHGVGVQREEELGRRARQRLVHRARVTAVLEIADDAHPGGLRDRDAAVARCVVDDHDLGPDGFGAFSFIFNLLGLLGLLADFQTSRIVIREVIDAGDDLDPVVGSFVTFRIALGALTYAIALAFVVFGNYPRVVVEGT